MLSFLKAQVAEDLLAFSGRTLVLQANEVHFLVAPAIAIGGILLPL